MYNKNPKNNVGSTPLHLAAQSGHLDICKIIIDNIDDVSPEDNNGRTPLYIAAQNGHLGIFKFINQVHVYQTKLWCFFSALLFFLLFWIPYFLSSFIK